MSPEGIKVLRYWRTVYLQNGYKVYPTEEHLNEVNELVRSNMSGVFEKKRFELMRVFYAWMREADGAIVCNTNKDIGVGTAIDIGVALGLGKEVDFLEPPSDPNAFTIHLHGYKYLFGDS